MDTTTGEIYSNSQDSIDELIETIEHAEAQSMEHRRHAYEARQKLIAMAQFNDGIKTSRVQGQKYRAKIELPSRVVWDQKELAKLFENYHLQPAISIAAYKVNMREYKKMINTTGDTDFNLLKEKLIKANLGTAGTAKVTIEEIK
jgi:hypothetical protein